MIRSLDLRVQGLYQRMKSDCDRSRFDETLRIGNVICQEIGFSLNGRTFYFIHEQRGENSVARWSFTTFIG